MKYLKLGVLVALFIGIFICGVLYVSHKRYIDDLNKDAEKLLNYYKIYSYDYFDIAPKTIDDFNNMLNWTRVTSGASDLDLSFLNYGYGIKYDSLSEVSYIYSYGKDRKDNNLKNTPYNKEKLVGSGNWNISDDGFFNFIFSFFKNKDIIILSIKNSIFNCEKAFQNSDNYPFYAFQLYQGTKNLWIDNSSKKKFLKLIGDFQRKFSEQNYKEGFGKENKIYVAFKRGKIYIICSNGFDENQIGFLKIELENYLSSRKDLFFDYALFSLDMIFDVKKI